MAEEGDTRNLSSGDGVVEPPKPPVVPTPPPVSEPAEDFSEPTSFPSFLKEESEETASSDAVQAPIVPRPVVPPTPETPSEEMPEENTDLTGPESPVLPAQESEPDLAESAEEPIEPAVPEPPENTDEPQAPSIPEPEQEPESPTIPTAPSAPVVPEAPVAPVYSETTEETDEKSESSSEEAQSDETDAGQDGETTETSSEESPEGANEDGENKEGEAEEAPVILDYKSEQFLESLFANGNECITAPSGSFPVKDDTRSLLALFSNGRFFVAEAARYDGKVLGFEYLATKRRLQVGKPEYVPTIVINDIYEYAAKNATKSFVPPTIESDTQEQVRMQRDFVTIISRAAMQHVSDIHIVVADHTTIMFRINGLMQVEMEYNKDWGESFVRAAFASADISDANYAQNEYQAAQKLGRTPLRGSGGRLLLPRNVLGIRLQFNPIAFGTRYVVMRLLYAEDNVNAASDLEALGFTKPETEIFYQMRAIPTGIVVISGPTGSGKSTTLQRNMIAMLKERDYEINLITVEDPPEYPIPGARQMPVTNAAVEEAKEREFTKALSAALRSDPDALMIGEIRTLSAADLAFRGALSGHNVWTTIHANSAPAILMRLKDIGVEDFKLQDPSIMKGMMAQRLFRKLCPHCRMKATDHLDHPSVQRLRQAFGDEALEQSFLRGPGFDDCDFRGVKGRTVIGEFLLPDATFLDLSVRGEFTKAMNYWINDLGGRTLRDNSISRMLAGIVDIEEVERWTGFLDQQILA